MRFHKLEEHLTKYIYETKSAINIEAEKVSLDLLRSSQKFYIGEISNLPELIIDFPIGNLPRLPFQNCSFEFSGEYNDERSTHFTVCVECEKGTEQNHTVFFVFILTPDGNFHYPGFLDINRSASLAQFHVSKNLVITDSERNDLTRLLLWKVSEIVRFLLVLNCVNVKTEIVEAPAALNKKRAKNGKLPLYSYKTLVLKSSLPRCEDQGGTHQSPRIHLCRGHIKHRKTGDFWWEPHVRGERKRGVVMKDYRADKLAAACA